MFSISSQIRWQHVPLFRWLVVGLMILPLASLFLSQPSAVFAGPSLETTPTFLYETVYNGGWLDSGRDVAVDAAGNAYVLAYVYNSNNDVLVLKLAPDGTVLWTTGIQGNALDIGTGIEVDDAGGVYIAGWTDSDDFPIVNALQPSRNGPRDAFLAKLSAQDGSFLFSTYFGGSRAEGANDVAVNSAGEIYLVGYTDSTDLPTVNPIQDQLNTSQCFCEDAFVTKISADGHTVLYSTYLGGASDDAGVSIGLDGNDNIFFAGDTKSQDFPTANPIQVSFAGGTGDAFVAQISSEGSMLGYSTYLGGEDWDRIGRIAVDDSGHTYVTGTTRSVGFPTTPGAFQEQFAGGILACGSPPFEPRRNCDDVFVTQVAPGGSALAYSTFLGGNRDEEGRGIAFDAIGRAHVVGYTASADFPPVGSIDAGDIFVSQLSADGGMLNYTLGIDSNSPNAGHGIAVGGGGDVYMTAAKNVPADIYVARLGAGLPPSQDKLHVDDIQLNGTSGEGFSVQVTVTIKDQSGQPVEGAAVQAGLATPERQKEAFLLVTDAMGQVSFEGQSETGGVWTACVLDVSKDGYIYDANQNNETCDSLAYPNAYDEIRLEG